jgi:hypothetical protein
MYARNSKDSSKSKLVVVDWDGFSGVPAGTRLIYVMTPAVLGCVETAAANIHRSRAWLLLATIMGDEIDPDAPIYIEANVVDPAAATFYGPLTFEYRIEGEDLGLAITATQDEAAMPEGELCTLLVEVAAEAGN